MNFFKLTFVALLLPLVSRAVDLRQGDKYRGEIFIGENPKKGCLVEVVSIDPMYTINVKLYDDRYRPNAQPKNSKNPGLRISGGRTFKGYVYYSSLTAKGSIFQVFQPETQSYKRMRNDNQLELNFNEKQAPLRALIFDGQRVVANCHNLKLEARK